MFYGAAPYDREELAQDLGLPEERAKSCPDEFDQAISSWGQIFDEMDVGTGGDKSFLLAPTSGAEPEALRPLMEAEISSLNSEFTLPKPVEVRVEPCYDANAFYDPEDVSITVCTEFVAHLEGLYQALD